MSNDPMRDMQQKTLTELINERNAVVGKINAATGNREALEESILNSNDDENLVNLREQLEELQAKVDKIVSEKVEAALTEGKEDVDGLNEDVKEKDQTIRAGISFYKKLYGDEAVAEDLPKVERLKGARVGGGGGGKRIRGYNVVVTIDEDVEEFENFATAAKFLGTDTASLQNQFFAKAGVEKLKDAPDEVTFQVTWTETDEDDNESEASALVKAYRTGPSGPPTSENSDEDEAEVPDEDELEEVG